MLQESGECQPAGSVPLVPLFLILVPFSRARLDEQGEAYKKTEKRQREVAGFLRVDVLADYRGYKTFDLRCHHADDNKSEDQSLREARERH